MPKKAADSCQRGFYGTTTLGEKGQVVIPASAREALKLEKGDTLLVFCMGEGMVAFSKLTHLKEMESHLKNKLKGVRALIQKNK